MHGSSSVPQELLAEIREFGGDMKETYGVPVEEIVVGIKHGVRKVNIDTDIRLAMTGAIRRYFVENPSKFDPRDYLKPAREAARKIVVARLEAFGAAGKASGIKAIPLEKMAERYKKGELAQQIL
jgi:fructose-bisphosphate aldolase class II